MLSLSGDFVNATRFTLEPHTCVQDGTAQPGSPGCSTSTSLTHNFDAKEATERFLSERDFVEARATGGSVQAGLRPKRGFVRASFASGGVSVRKKCDRLNIVSSRVLCVR